MLFDADGYYLTDNSDLILFHKSSAEEANNLQELLTPTMLVSVATFPCGEWKGVYLQDGVDNEQ